MLKRSIHLLALVVAAGLLALGAAACGDDDDDDEEPTATAAAEATEPPVAQIPSVEFTGTDFAFEGPSSIAGGVTRVVFTNDAETEDHQAQLVKLNEGVTMEDLGAAGSEAEIFALVTAHGGPGAGPGRSNENVLDLEAGDYAVVCFIPSPDDGIPHVAKGMIAPLEVTEAPAEQPEVPAADASVGLSDFAFDGPTSFAAGEVTLEAVNNGPQPHELAVFQLAEGLTYEDFSAILAAGPPGPDSPPPMGPPPFSFVGQVAVLSDGESGQTTIDLSAGTYAFLCFITDPESGAPHFALGMAAEVLVE